MIYTHCKYYRSACNRKIELVTLYIHYIIDIYEEQGPTGLHGHQYVRDSSLTSSQKGSYLHVDRPIIKCIKINNDRGKLHCNPLTQWKLMCCTYILIHLINIIPNINPPHS